MNHYPFEDEEEEEGIDLLTPARCTQEDELYHTLEIWLETVRR